MNLYLIILLLRPFRSVTISKPKRLMYEVITYQKESSNHLFLNRNLECFKIFQKWLILSLILFSLFKDHRTQKIYCGHLDFRTDRLSALLQTVFCLLRIINFSGTILISLRNLPHSSAQILS